MIYGFWFRVWGAGLRVTRKPTHTAIDLPRVLKEGAQERFYSFFTLKPGDE